MYEISELYVYPIKSLGGIALNEAKLSECGIEYDRYWMLIDDNGRFITQRDIPKLALFKLKYLNDSLIVEYENHQIAIPTSLRKSVNVVSYIWKEDVIASRESVEINNWFSQILEKQVYLVRKADNYPRYVKKHKDSGINFPDSDQYLLTGQSSLDYLNSKLENQLNINRFRPNIVFKGGEFHAEDSWKIVAIGDSKFEITKACARCKLTTINQESGELGKEPLKTLSKYRRSGGEVYFGQYLKLISSQDLTIKIGDKLIVEERK